MKKSLHLIISGKVQGVYYRLSTKNEALRLNLTGWVRNLNNGDVEVSAFGDENDLKSFLNWCYQGPELSEVKSIKTEWNNSPQNINSDTFEIIADH